MCRTCGRSSRDDILRGMDRRGTEQGRGGEVMASRIREDLRLLLGRSPSPGSRHSENPGRPDPPTSVLVEASVGLSGWLKLVSETKYPVFIPEGPFESMSVIKSTCKSLLKFFTRQMHSFPGQTFAMH